MNYYSPAPPRRLNAIVYAVLLLALSGFDSAARADYPDMPITVDLGPGNEDFEATFGNDVTSLSGLRKALHRVDGFDLSGRDLRRAEIHTVLFALRNVNFDGSDLTGANLLETVFDNCSFRNAVLRRIPLTAAELRPNCDLTGADISGSVIFLTGEQLLSTKNYKERILAGTYLSGDFSGISFAEFNLRGTVFRNSKLHDCDFTDADISRSSIQLTKEQLKSTENFRIGDLDRVRFWSCDFGGIDFSGHDLGQFVKCDLAGAQFSDASFSQTVGGFYPLSRHGEPGPYGFSECNLTAEQFYSTRTYKSGKLPSGFSFQQMDLSEWDFSGMDLRGVDFHLCNLEGANLENARGGVFRTATGMTVAQVESTWNYKQGKMSELGFELPTYLVEQTQE